ncbi:beta-N-acetylhexosaminidase [Amnibacterium endophyticum]|uniref:Beta-N-acetylhexosaminidase n=1 Tax=Amnibacterium endophyticum TaxID=2109337 RepID=A0ABW4LH12_9MICO
MSADLRRLALGVLLPGFAGTALPASIEALLRDGLAGVALFGPNVVDVAQVRALTDAVRTASPSAVVAIDEEGGDVTRLHVPDGSPEPGNGVLGRLDDVDGTAASAHRIGLELAAAGVRLDLAPTVDVNTNPDNPVIGARSFGEDPSLVARHAAAWVRGLQSAGVAACAKHFPGHGDTAVDSHLGLPVVDRDLDALTATDLPPFVAAVEAGVAAVMTSHILLPALDPDAPATMSRRILTGLLREELGFDGVVVSDALDMAGASGTIGVPAAAVRALVAGADLLCLGKHSEHHVEPAAAAIEAAVEEGALPLARLEDAVARVRALRVPAAADGPRPLPARLAAAFDVRPGAVLPRPGEAWTVVRLDVEANIAVGETGWGPFAAASDTGRFASWPRIDVDADEAGAAPEVAGPVLVVGRDVHRHPHVRAVVDALRDRGGSVLVVDMGWPSPDRRYADVATFGSSRAVGAALLGLLTGEED